MSIPITNLNVAKKMKLSEFKKQLAQTETLTFVQPNGAIVPLHFHITEVGLSTKHFIDCGNSVHVEKKANLQIWLAADIFHRLKPSALLGIIESSKMVLGDEDLDIEVEYQTDTVGKYALSMSSGLFQLVPTHTDCLAKTACIVEPIKQKMVELATAAAGCCSPGGGCC